MIKNAIKKIRKKHDLTQKEFADLLGITITTLSRYERGESPPNQTMKQLMSFSPDALSFSKQQAKKLGLL